MATDPLSVGPVAGLTTVEPPKTSAGGLMYPKLGALLAVTLTVKLAVFVPLFASVTVKVTVFAPRVAVQLAARVAVIVPVVLVMLVTEMPAGTVVAVTTKLPAD